MILDDSTGDGLASSGWDPVQLNYHKLAVFIKYGERNRDRSYSSVFVKRSIVSSWDRLTVDLRRPALEAYWNIRWS